MIVCIEKGKGAYETTKRLLDRLHFSVKDKKVLIKPNLTIANTSKSGITTDVNIVRAIVERLQNCDITIGEGSGEETMHAFSINGYKELADEFGAKLIDLNKDEIIYKKIPKPFAFKEVPFAKTALNCDYLINVAKLKTHCTSTVTLCLKNLFGTVVPRKNRTKIHFKINRAICDFIQVLHSDFNIIDGIVGNQCSEVRSNPVNSEIVIGGYNALSVDIVGTKCMCINPDQVKHIVLAQKLLGRKGIKVIGEDIEKVKKIYKQGSLLTVGLRYATEIAYRISKGI